MSTPRRAPDPQWSPTGRRPRRSRARVAAVLAGPVLVAVLGGAGLLAFWPAVGLAALALLGGAALFGRVLAARGAEDDAAPDTGDFVPGARVVVVGGGYAGLVAARALQRRRGVTGDGRHHGNRNPRLRAATPIGTITVVDPQPHMTYQPFLPEAAGGSITPRHLTVSLRRVLGDCEVLTGSVVGVDDARRRAMVHLPDGEMRELRYDVLVVAPGAVARELPVPGLAERALTFRSATDAARLHDHVLSRLDAAASTEDPARRRRLLTFVVIGGGFAGLEALGELEDLARRSARRIGLAGELRWVLVEAAQRIMPEVTPATAARVHGGLTRRGVEVRVGAGITSAEGGVVRLADGTAIETDTVLVAAGARPHPLLERTDLPLDRTGKVRCTAMLQVVGRPHVFAAGDGAAVPDLARGVPINDEDPSVLTPPTAQHAVRQARRLADNVVAHLGGRPLQPYSHRNAGCVAGLGRRRGVAEIRGVRVTGWPAYVLHRAYHLWAMPTADRKARILLDWAAAAVLGRDPVAVGAVSSGTPQALGDDAVVEPALPALPSVALPSAGTPAVTGTAPAVWGAAAEPTLLAAPTPTPSTGVPWSSGPARSTASTPAGSGQPATGTDTPAGPALTALPATGDLPLTGGTTRGTRTGERLSTGSSGHGPATGDLPSAGVGRPTPGDDLDGHATAARRTVAVSSGVDGPTLREPHPSFPPTVAPAAAHARRPDPTGRHAARHH